MKDHKFQHGAKMNWTRYADNATLFNEVAVWVLETFGLPGDKFIVDIGVNEMTWWFAHSQDRMLFVLRNGSAKCIELNYQT